MLTHQQQAQQLTYQQRKALRRLGRGQSISKSMQDDPVIERCISREHYLPAPDVSAMSYVEGIVQWCDWEAHAMHHNTPRLNAHGKAVLDALCSFTQSSSTLCSSTQSSSTLCSSTQSSSTQSSSTLDAERNK